MMFSLLLLAISSKPRKNSTYSCEMCIRMNDFIDRLKVQTDDQEKIVHYTSTLCPKYKTSYQSLCFNLATNYVPLIISYQKSGYNSKEICEKFGIC